MRSGEPAELGLFDEPVRIAETAVPPDERTTGQRRRDRQLAAILRGQHPLSVALGPIPLHELARRDGDRTTKGTPRCGGCRFREQLHGGARSYPKCTFGTVDRTRPATRPERELYRRTTVGYVDRPRASHGEATDCASWWPACTAFQPIGDESDRSPTCTVKDP